MKKNNRNIGNSRCGRRQLLPLLVILTALFLAFGMQSPEVWAVAKKSGESNARKFHSAARYIKKDGKIEFEYEDTELLTAESAGALTGSLSIRKNSKKIGSAAEDGASAIPLKYDLRQTGRMSPVGDQGETELCWAFSACASLESNMITKGFPASSVDLSEAHLGYFVYHGANGSGVSRYAGKDRYRSEDADSWITSGGNYIQAASAMARWYGPVNESVLPFSEVKSGAVFPSSLQTKRGYTLTEMSVLPSSLTIDRSGAVKLNQTGMNAIKKEIMSGGAVASTVEIDELDGLLGFGTDQGSEMLSYYYEGSDDNHGITIAGWDDDYSRENFKSINDNGESVNPPGNGAWLIKNSWGTSDEEGEIHDSGYFWASYYNPSISSFYSFRGSPKNAPEGAYTEIYQYDGTGIGENTLFRKDARISTANTYKARKDTLINGIGTWTVGAENTVNVKIYVNKQKSSPTSGTLLFNKNFTPRTAGYHVLNLGKNVGIPAGAKFSVVIRTRDKNTGWFVPLEIDVTDPCNDPGMISLNAQKSGESYYYDSDLGKWQDTKTMKKQLSDDDTVNRLGNALAKALGKTSGTSSQKIKVKTGIKVKKGKTIRLKAQRTKGNGKLVYSSGNVKTAVVSSSGKVTAKKTGTVKITVRALPTAACRSAEKQIAVKIVK